MSVLDNQQAFRIGWDTGYIAAGREFLPIIENLKSVIDYQRQLLAGVNNQLEAVNEECARARS